MKLHIDTYLSKLFDAQVGDISIKIEQNTEWYSHKFPTGELLKEPLACNGMIIIHLEFTSTNPYLDRVGSLIVVKKEYNDDAEVKNVWHYLCLCVSGKETNELLQSLCVD